MSSSSSAAVLTGHNSNAVAILRRAARIARDIRDEGFWSHLALNELEALGHKLRRSNPWKLERVDYFASSSEAHLALRAVQAALIRYIQRQPNACPFATGPFLVRSAALARLAGERRVATVLLVAAAAARRRHAQLLAARRPAAA